MTPRETPEDCCASTSGSPTGSEVNCPACGWKGKLVKPITIESLVTEQARARGESVDGFRFCANPACDVAYFDNDSGERFVREEVRVRIGQKETASPRPICYCFDHTDLEIEAEVAATGSSTIPGSIGAKCKQGLDRCEELNPQGSCCLGNVRAVMKAAQQSLPAKQGEQQ